MIGDPLEILLRHNAWATRVVLERCRGLSDEQWRRRFAMGPGSLQDTLTHIIGAMLRWADRISGSELRGSIERPPLARARSVDELLVLLDEAAARLRAAAEVARREGMETTVGLKFPQADGTMKDYTFTRGAALVHVTTHGVHHRAQCVNMLRQLGVGGLSEPENLPEVAVVEWQAEGEA